MMWSVGEVPEAGIGTRVALRDSLFLAAVVFLSCLPYLGGLGLYSDDWAFLSELHSVRGSFRRMYDILMPMGLTTRPVQALDLILLYSLFGLEPLGYHVFNSLVLAATAVLLYLALRQFGVPRAIAVAVPGVYGLLPHYSTDRVWIAAFQANVSVCLYAASVYADLQFLNARGGRRWLWKAAGTIALLGSVLAYEVTGLLFLVTVLALWYRARAPRRDAPRPSATMLVLGSNVLALALAIAYKVTTTERTALGGGYIPRALRIVKEAVPVHFGEYGLALPMKIAHVLRDSPEMLALAVSVCLGILVWAYLQKVVRPPDAPFLGRGSWLAVTLLGGILFVAGYGVALTTWEIGFHTTGSNNRTAVAAAIGVSCAFVGAIGWGSSWLPSDRLRWTTFSILIALLAAGSSLLTSAVARFWVSAARQQDRVIASIRERFPEMPPGTRLLLDGVCPFDGPAVVFATSWDVTGILQLRYGDRSLQGDVVKANTEATPEGVRTMLFDDVISVYPYGDRLVVYHLGTGGVFPLTTIDVARRYLETVSAAARPACPRSTDGDGVSVF